MAVSNFDTSTFAAAWNQFQTAHGSALRAWHQLFVLFDAFLSFSKGDKIGLFLFSVK